MGGGHAPCGRCRRHLLSAVDMALDMALDMAVDTAVDMAVDTAAGPRSTGHPAA